MLPVISAEDLVPSAAVQKGRVKSCCFAGVLSLLPDSSFAGGSRLHVPMPLPLQVESLTVRVMGPAMDHEVGGSYSRAVA